ncbi:hypothetical protein LINGRAHAP2_LOCUS10453 [Linum grandiflorum]
MSIVKETVWLTTSLEEVMAFLLEHIMLMCPILQWQVGLPTIVSDHPNLGWCCVKCSSFLVL